MEFTEYWQYTDWVTKTLLFALFALSIASWIAGIIRIIDSVKLKNNADDLLTANLPQGIGREATEQHLLQRIGRFRHRSERGLAVLGTTAAIAPFIGLIGTVWGIFHALHSIGQTGQAGLGQVAGPVGEALIMTGLGLAVAIPAVILYNIATRLNRSGMHLANDTAYGVLATVQDQPKTHEQMN